MAGWRRTTLSPARGRSSGVRTSVPFARCQHRCQHRPPRASAHAARGIARLPGAEDLDLDRGAAGRDALLAVARQKVSVATVATLLGTWVWAALLRRDVFSIPSAIFGFVERCRNQTVCWWPSARREAVAMAKVVPWLFATLSNDFCLVMTAADAMGAHDREL